MTRLARILFCIVALVSSLYPLVATAQADKPVSIVVFARDPSPSAKGKLLEQVARERGLSLEWVYTDRTQPAELAQRFAGADLIMFDWVMDFLLPQIFAQVQEPMKAYQGKVWGGARTFPRGYRRSRASASSITMPMAVPRISAT